MQVDCEDERVSSSPFSVTEVHSCWATKAALHRYSCGTLVKLMLCAGKFYTLATGSNERRWNKMKPRLEQVVQSFEVQNRYDSAPVG